jgi:translation initiation factor 4A
VELQHSDQGDTERAEALNNFHTVATAWSQRSSKSSAPKSETTADENTPLKKSGLLVITDACLPTTALGEASLGARVLIHYDLPAKKVIICTDYHLHVFALL